MKQRNIMTLILALALLVGGIVLFSLFLRQDGPPASSPGDMIQLPVKPDEGDDESNSSPPPSAGAEPSTSGGLALSEVSLNDFRAETPYVELNGNQPAFSENEMSTEAFENYAPLDSLGRCGVAYANICQELMPTEKREGISRVKPTGWHSVRYDNVDGKNLYNRCHLIGFQLAGENANELNLITGTRYLNVDGMLPFENMVADYVKETGNHVLYRVTPVFQGENLVADGVQMEAFSVEDRGDGVCFNVFCYNAQPGIAIDYATGESHADSSVGFAGQTIGETMTYILNTGSKKFHLADCSGVGSISEKNRDTFTGTRAELVAQGYVPCGICKP